MGQAAVPSHEVSRTWECPQARRHTGRQGSGGAWDGAFPSRCSLYFLLPFAFVAISPLGLALLPPSRCSLGLLLLLFQRGDLCCAPSVRVQECPAESRAGDVG